MTSHRKQFNGRPGNSQAGGPEYKASDFEFAVMRGDADMGTGKLAAVIRPKGDEEGWKKSYEIAQLLKGAKPVDDCVYVFWTFPKKLDTPAALSSALTAKGLTWSKSLQEEMEPGFTREIAAQTVAPKKQPKPRTP